MTLRTRLVMFGAAQLIVVVGCLLFLYYRQARNNVQNQFVEKARGILLTAESTREEMGKNWDRGLFSPEQLSAWAKAGQMDKVMAGVPVISAIRSAEAKAEEAGYRFRVPKFDARNPKNNPDDFEARVLKHFEATNAAEYFEIDPELNAVRYFRPVRLTQECLLCHGDPAQSEQLWGNSDGRDPTGAKMENWKVGDVRGAFEVIQSLSAADAAIQKQMMMAGAIACGFVLVGAAVFAWLVQLWILKPVGNAVNQLNVQADEVSHAASQVATAADQLANGAMKQAEAVALAANDLNQVSAQSRATCESAARAGAMVGQARDDAQRGDGTMHALGTAMQAINSSAVEVQKVISAIEELAFQTRLLALNAAVEAERAGESGRGFAVVASEVRRLAQRSAEAAGNSAELIAASVDQARQGGSVAGEAGTVLAAIVSDVNQVTGCLDEIVSASGQQAGSVERINTSVGEIDRITQSTAATAEQYNATAQVLLAQAEEVKCTVTRLATIVRGKGAR